MTQPLNVSSFVPVQDLYEAARAVLAAKGGDPAAARAARDKLRRAVAAVEEAARVSAGLGRVRDRAEAIYVDSCHDVDIDAHNFTHHNGVDGYWVGAWLWVGDESAAEDDGAGAAP
jgi:hypothetical protein